MFTVHCVKYLLTYFKAYRYAGMTVFILTVYYCQIFPIPCNTKRILIYAKHFSSHTYTYLESTTAAALHQIADVSWLNGCSNKWFYIVMIQFLQLQTQKHKVAQKYTRQAEQT